MLLNKQNLSIRHAMRTGADNDALSGISISDNKTTATDGRQIYRVDSVKDYSYFPETPGDTRPDSVDCEVISRKDVDQIVKDLPKNKNFDCNYVRVSKNTNEKYIDCTSTDTKNTLKRTIKRSLLAYPEKSRLDELFKQDESIEKREFILPLSALEILVKIAKDFEIQKTEKGGCTGIKFRYGGVKGGLFVEARSKTGQKLIGKIQVFNGSSD